MEPGATKRDSVGAKILGYLRDYRDASDTFEGVLEWWIPQREHRLAADEVDAALRELVAAQCLVAETSADGRTHYRLHPRKKREFANQISCHQRRGKRRSRSGLTN